MTFEVDRDSEETFAPARPTGLGFLLALAVNLYAYLRTLLKALISA